MNDRIILTDFPMPPTVNQAYETITRKVWVKGRLCLKSTMIHSDKFKGFANAVEHWKTKNYRALDQAAEMIQGWILSGDQVRVDYHFLWPHDDIFTKTKRAKNKLHRLDADNRIKPGRDQLALCIGVDDTHFTDGRIEKAIQQEGKTECAIISLSRTKIRTAKEILTEYNLSPLVA